MIILDIIIEAIFDKTWDNKKPRNLTWPKRILLLIAAIVVIYLALSLSGIKII